MADSPGKRLVAFRESLGLGQRDFGATLGTSNATVGYIEKDIRKPSRGFLIKISDVYGINSDWLLNGHGEMMRAPGQGFSGRAQAVSAPDYARPGHGDVRFGDHEYAFVKRMDLSISAGNGLTPDVGEDAAGMAFPVSWFERRGLNSDLTVLVTVKGDSMAPAIPDGALVLVDLTQKMPNRPGVYAFNWDGQSFVKRLMPTVSGEDKRPSTLVVASDNPAFPPIALSGAQMNAVQVVGRVRAVLSEI
ncbi:LexA family transcriptional regulator [Tabrizicola sp.]|jgi:phage repressor protein C with HTH and peptisase S24 domain|uniref:XRE family transcriptional regulator n=1 Tax=Tabrizicola sp. TaxID=2005166 RepID=UPI0025E73106|nr:LexA family transcriptional regulator [Tabrizicola sp.]MBY0349777.1 LexA family transcriptional regulator [Tabrizicola sp.]